MRRLKLWWSGIRIESPHFTFTKRPLRLASFIVKDQGMIENTAFIGLIKVEMLGTSTLRNCFLENYYGVIHQTQSMTSKTACLDVVQPPQ